jgi:hypothetical protein
MVLTVKDQDRVDGSLGQKGEEPKIKITPLRRAMRQNPRGRKERSHPLAELQVRGPATAEETDACLGATAADPGGVCDWVRAACKWVAATRGGPSSPFGEGDGGCRWSRWPYQSCWRPALVINNRNPGPERWQPLQSSGGKGRCRREDLNRRCLERESWAGRDTRFSRGNS